MKIQRDKVLVSKTRYTLHQFCANILTVNFTGNMTHSIIAYAIPIPLIIVCVAFLYVLFIAYNATHYNISPALTLGTNFISYIDGDTLDLVSVNDLLVSLLLIVMYRN